MFTVRNTDLFAEDGQLVLGGIGAEVRAEGDAPVRLVYQAEEHSTGSDRFGSFSQYTLQFADGAEPARMAVRLQLKCYARFVLGYVEGEIKKEFLFQSWKSFSPGRAIAITVERLGEVRGLMANYLHKDWWLRPHFDPDPANLPDNTQSMLWRDNSAYCRLLPVCGPIFRADLCGSRGGGAGSGFSIALSAFQGGISKAEALAFILGRGEDPFELGDRLTGTALQALGAPERHRKSKAYPEILDYLGWCSWDAFYQKVDESGLLAKAEEFAKLGLPVRWFMIDDGWLDTEAGRLRSFEAAPDKFPHGLAHAIDQLKNRYGLRWVGVWHTIAGYWEGVAENSAIGSALSPYLHRTVSGTCVPHPDPALGFGFWHARHGFLQRQGVDFVKVDSQSSIRHLLKHERSVGAAAAGAHQALEASAALHFNGTIINCMGMASENVWHRPMSAVSRNSDDFMPKERRGFREHALQNAYNSYYHGSFYWGDWDMFWTINHDDKLSSVLRAVSGGPVYVSDALGATNPALLRPLIYDDGRLVRCDRTSSPTADCLTVDPRSAAAALKIWNTAGGAGVIAAFHIFEREEPIRSSVGAADIPELGGERVLVYEYFSKTLRRLDAGERLEFELDPETCKLFVLVPAAADAGVVPIGAADKYAAPHAIVRQWRTGGRTHVIVRPNVSGAFAFWSDSTSITVTVDREEQPLHARGGGLYEIELAGADRSRWIEIAVHG
jgi:hypothetical protein